MKLLIALLPLLSFHVGFLDAMANSELMTNMPYYAYVTFTSVQMSFYGGGALISTSHVLTCAANIKGFTSWRVGLGSNRRVNHVTLNSNRAVSHPDFVENDNFRTNDIGIIFLQQPAEISESVYPIFLPPMNHISDPMLGIQGMVLGFAGNATTGNEGLQILQAAHVRTMDHSSCLQHYALADKNYQFCAEDVEESSNFCLGDQGGPFTIVTRDEEFLVGIASLPGCVTIPSLYIRISFFRQWIRSQTEI